jgi:hypothetical protein
MTSARLPKNFADPFVFLQVPEREKPVQLHTGLLMALPLEHIHLTEFSR